MLVVEKFKPPNSSRIYIVVPKTLGDLAERPTELSFIFFKLTVELITVKLIAVTLVRSSDRLVTGENIQQIGATLHTSLYL